MSLTTPVIQPFSPFPSTSSQTVSFSVGSGSNQATQNKINIYNTTTNTLIFTNTVQTFLLQAVIPANTLTNSITPYKVTIQTGDINNNWSTESDPLLFYCLSSPTYNFTNIDISGKVYNQNVTFSCDYFQVEGEQIQSYIYYLYDQNQSLIQSYTNTFTSTSPLTQLVSGLANNTLYYIQVKTVSVHGQLGDSGLVAFTPLYVLPSLFSTLTTTQVPSTGSIKISAILLQETGVMESGTAIYQDNTWIDLTQGGKVAFQDGFSINSSNFIAKIWCKNIPLDTVFCTIYSLVGKIDLHMEPNQAHAYVYLNNLTTVKYHFVSNTLDLTSDLSYDSNLSFDTSVDAQVFMNTIFNEIQVNQPFMIYLKCVNGLLDLYLTLV